MSSVVADYYDGFRERLLADYHDGNPRVDMALAFSGVSLRGARSVLDVGCGIGWSSIAIYEALRAKIVGVDISPVLIETASEMFGDVCDFVAADFTSMDIPGVFDAVLMIDSYEHFPRSSRPLVHAQIAKTDCGRVVLTVPTPATNQYARDHGIALQIIDEDVTDEDISVLATDVGGTVEINRLVSIYRPDDYRHILIRRQPCR